LGTASLLPIPPSPRRQMRPRHVAGVVLLTVDPSLFSSNPISTQKPHLPQFFPSPSHQFGCSYTPPWPSGSITSRVYFINCRSSSVHVPQPLPPLFPSSNKIRYCELRYHFRDRLPYSYEPPTKTPVFSPFFSKLTLFLPGPRSSPPLSCRYAPLALRYFWKSPVIRSCDPSVPPLSPVVPLPLFANFRFEVPPPSGLATPQLLNTKYPPPQCPAMNLFFISLSSPAILCVFPRPHVCLLSMPPIK